MDRGCDWYYDCYREVVERWNCFRCLDSSEFSGSISSDLQVTEWAVGRVMLEGWCFSVWSILLVIHTSANFRLVRCDMDCTGLSWTEGSSDSINDVQHSVLLVQLIQLGDPCVSISLTSSCSFRDAIQCRDSFPKRPKQAGSNFLHTLVTE